MFFFSLIILGQSIAFTFSPIFLTKPKVNRQKKSYVSRHSRSEPKKGPCYESLYHSDEKDEYLQITGEKPDWLQGSLIRVGPGMFKFGENEEVSCWFDGQAMLCRFEFSEKGIHYSNRFLDTKNIREHLKHGKVSALEFGSCPEDLKNNGKQVPNPEKIIRRLRLSSQEYENNNVNCFALGNHTVALSETKTYVEFNPKTLETQGVLKDSETKCHLGTAHPLLSNTDNTVYTIGSNLLERSYVISSLRSSEEEIVENELCTIQKENISYMHSFAITQDHIILIEFPYILRPLSKIILDKLNFILTGFFNQDGLNTFYSWQPEEGTSFLVLSKETGELIGRWHTKESFFAFHLLNAFIDKDSNLSIDLASYDKPFYDKLDLATLRENSETVDHLKEGSIKRCKLKLEDPSQEVLIDDMINRMVEMPSWNGNYQGLEYKYCYGISIPENQEESNKNTLISLLIKVDLKTKEKKIWKESYCAPGEPIFVPNPDASKEDDGVIMSLVFDNRINKSFLLLLDATSFEEIGRAILPNSIPAGIHGQWFDH
ncbi:MAG: hypothetical protein CMP11_03555 [Zetaproteobacteria bacterium]|nr:hypothetical protein [Pseudobdellovibrionaceae bacterium]|tara:strand:+ start:170 stop:1801 length:1632 start_codon:yes stop_codon:yes gene_type:complete